ncbi:MAG: family 20 glycosylhydrolase [Acidobacteria bacterium]|nr:family 20 glycosylhydrolase [Acidobacteriota bacterium]
MAIKNTLVAFVLFLSFNVSAQNVQLAETPQHNLMPVPASVRFNAGRLLVNDSFTVAVHGHNDVRLTAAIDRMARRLEARTGFTFARGLASDSTKAALVIECQSAGKPIPAVDENETYSLEVTNSQAAMKAPTVVGAIRGLETFLQLLSGDKDGFFIPAVSIDDKPRFPWRGLMIDIGRHWQPMEVIKRNLDGMAAVKLNVLHLHITEDQGFRIESKKYPELHLKGSDGNFYTQAEMREIIEYARMRGIRVVPEFDMPGHTTSWFVSHPELASKPGPYQIERKWGIFEPVFDPTNEKLYQLLDGFFGEMAALFPDAYMHIGGDEVEAHHWKENPKIQAFMKEKGLADNHALQAYFNKRVAAIVTKHGKKMIGWDEVVHPDIPKNIVVQSWRGQESLASAAKQGYTGILSNGYYIDLMYPTRDHYLNDPIPENTALTAEEQKLILGGEATMWSEWTSPETIDSRIWPRTAAIAERFWSPREVKDVDDMYRRLAVVSVQLEDVGLLHDRNQPAMIRRLLGGELAQRDDAVEAVKSLVDIVEPVKRYKRGAMQKATQFTPLTRLVDIARADSQVGRKFAASVEQFLYKDLPNSQDSARQGKFVVQPHAATLFYFVRWANAGQRLRVFAQESAGLSDSLLFANDLIALGQMGEESLQFLTKGETPPESWRMAKLKQLDEAVMPRAAVEFAILPTIKELVIAAAEQEKRKTMSSEDWKKMVKDLVAPKRK